MSDVKAEMAEATREVTRQWWLTVLLGVMWVIYGFVVLSADLTTVWAIAVLFGIGFIAGGVLELGLAFVAPGWRWLHAVFGVISIVAGVVALAWPGQTFLVLAAIIGWYLMFDGIWNIMVAFATRELNPLWWLGLILGVVTIGIGVWAVGHLDRSVLLLVIWVGVGALARGLSDIVIGFSLYGADRKMRRIISGGATA